MAYAAITKPSLYMNTKIYTGTGSSNAVTGVGFQPDLTWVKDRDAANWNCLMDAVRGVSKVIYSNATDAEATVATLLTSFDSDGFTLGTSNDGNTNTNDYVGWNWKANGAGSLNEVGSIDSTVSVNTTSGFSIAKYTGDASSGATIGHGLGSIPKMIIVKNLSIVSNWLVYNYSMSANGDYALFLDSSSAKDNSQDYWGDTTPTSSVFSLGARQEGNGSGNSMIAYCFADVKGFSKSSTYVGNGNADGPFIYTGFKPAWVMVKETGNTNSWRLVDNKRSPSNVMNNTLYPNLDNAQETSSNEIDFLSNGFKPRTSDTNMNRSAGNYIYMAFAEEPLVANVGASIPATAR